MENKITIYTSSFINGEELKTNLVQKGVEFKEKNISDDITARNKIILQGLRKLPVLEVDGRFIEGANDINSLV